MAPQLTQTGIAAEQPGLRFIGPGLVAMDG